MNFILNVLRLRFLCVFLSVALASCSTLRPEGAPIANSPDQHLIVILGTNDIHGALAPMDLKTREADGVKPVDYQAGGAVYLASYIHKLKNEFGNRILWLDAGDEFQGTIESNTDLGAPMVTLFNSLGLDAAAVGNHEFDFGLDPLEDRMREAHYSYLAANIESKKSGELYPFPNTLPSKLFLRGGVRVGVIGLSTLDTPTTTRAENVKTLTFASLKEATLREAKALRAQGAQILLITGHVGIGCQPGRVSSGHVFRKLSDDQGECDVNDEMTKLLYALPLRTVDAVVSGHSHKVVHHWVNGIPVIQAGASGRYLNLIYLTYDDKTHRVLSERTRIEGPVPICPKVFDNQGDCNGDRPPPKKGRGDLVIPEFHGEKINANAATALLLEPTFAKSRVIKEKVLTQAVRPIEHYRNKESPLGNVIADAVRAATGADFAIINAGGIRADWEQGAIHYGDVFRSLPFDNSLVKIDVTGRQLKMILRVAESGARGFPPVSGLTLRLIDPSIEAPVNDLNGNHKIEPWEVNRLLDVKLSNGKSLNDDKHYTLATIDFLATGGDDYAWPMSQIPKGQFHFENTLLLRDIVAQYVEKNGPLGDAGHPLIDVAHPRIKFVKIEKKGKRRRSSHGAKRRAKVKV